jgi:2-dehydropantoate 2-reductase
VFNITIIGAGAIGLFIGGKLLDNGNQISFVARSNFAEMQSIGFALKVNDEADFKAYKSEAVFQKLTQIASNSQDCVILCTTAADNVSYSDELMQVLKPNGVVVSLQNGLNFEGDIYDKIKPHMLLSGTCWIKVSKNGATHVTHDFGMRIILGRYRPEKIELAAPSVSNFTSIMLAAGFELEVVDRYLAPQLTKLTINLPFFGLMLRYRIKQAKVVKLYKDQLEGLQQEVINVARQLNAPVDELYVAQINTQLSGLAEQDLDAEELKRLAKEIAPNFQAFFNLASDHLVMVSKLNELYTYIKIHILKS